MRFEISAGVVIFRKDKAGKVEFLLLQQSSNSMDLPKGHIEKGENVYVAALRETREETGLVALPLPFFRFELEYFFRKGMERVRKKVVMLLGELPFESKVHISKEHKGYKWLDFESAISAFRFKDQKALITSCNDYINRRDHMERLNKAYSMVPDKVPGWSLSKRLVKGEGPINAKVMVIGQAPGEREEQTGRPFVGRSGKLLDELLRAAGLRRSRVYITSLVQFFPPKNRIPERHEIEVCKPFLEEQLRIVRPKLVVLLGALSSQELAGIGNPLQSHGTLLEKDGIRYFLTLHPAAAVRIQKNLPIITADFKKLRQILKTV